MDAVKPSETAFPFNPGQPLSDLGWTAFFQRHLDNVTDGQRVPARVVGVRKNSFYVRFSGNKEDDFKQFSTETLCEKAKDVNILLWPSGSVPLDVCDKRQVNSVIVRLSPELIFDLCAFKYQNKEYVDYIECQPEYAGKSVAEKNFEKK